MTTLDHSAPERAISVGAEPTRLPGPDEALGGRPGAELVDAILLQEIVLLADVIASVSGVRNHLSPVQVDAVLGVPPSPSPAAPFSRAARTHPADVLRIHPAPATA
jgi:hypothetical protein